MISGIDILRHCCPIEKVRIDYLEKSLTGNVAMFLRLAQLQKEAFECE